MAKFCENCGAALNEGSKFCPECGKEVPAAQPRPAQTARKNPAAQAAAEWKQQAAPRTVQPARKPTEKKTGRRGLSLLLVLALLAELAVAGFKYPGFLKKDGGPDEAGQTQAFAPPAPEKAETYTAQVSYAQPAVQCGSVAVDLGWWNLDGDDQLVVQSQPVQTDAATGAKQYAYDISLASGKHEFATDVVVTLPRHAGPGDKGVVLHYNDDTGAWEEAYTQLSADGSAYLVYTNHFSGFMEQILENVFGDQPGGTGIFREVSTDDASRMLAPVEVDKDALTELYAGENDDFALQILALIRQGAVLDAKDQHTYADVGGNLVGFAEKGNQLGMYQSVLSPAAQKTLGGWLSRAGYLLTGLKIVSRVQGGETVGEAVWNERADLYIAAAAGAAEALGAAPVAFVITSIPLMNWLDQQTESLAEWSRTYIGFNNQDKLYLVKAKEARYGEFFNYYDTHPITLALAGETFTLQADGTGWAELIDHAFTTFAATPNQITDTLEKAYNDYVGYYHNLPQTEQTDWYETYCIAQDDRRAMSYPKPNEELKTAYRTELMQNIKSRTMAILQARYAQAQREGVEALLQELNADVLPLLNQKLVFTVTTPDGSFGDTARGRMEPPGPEGYSMRTTEKPRLHFLNVFEPADALFFPLDVDDEFYPQNAFLPAPTPGSSVVFECTWFHYLMMGAPTTMVFDGFMEDGETYDEVTRDFKVEGIDGEGTVEISIDLNEFDLSFFMGDWKGIAQGMAYELSLYQHEDYISVHEEVDGDGNWSSIEVWNYDPNARTLTVPTGDDHVAAVFKAVVWDGSAPDAMDFIVGGETIRLTRWEGEDDDE